MANATAGFSGADLALLCEDATEQAMEASVESGDTRPITQKQLVRAAKSTSSSLGPWMESARNFALYSNDGGEYDDLLAYLQRHP